MRQLSQVFRNFARNCVRSQNRHPARRQAAPIAAAHTELFETRQLLAATPIAGLSDEFDNAASTEQWQRLNEVEGWNADQLDVYDINATQSSRMVQQPHTVVWYQNWRGPMAFQNVAGDFVFTTEIHIADRDDIGGSDDNDVPGDSLYSLAGAMIRTPRDITDALTEWTPGSMADDGTNNGENYIFLSAGYGAGNPDEFALEVKTTRNSNSQLELTPIGADSNIVRVQLARIGDSVIALYQLPGEEWTVHRRYSRPDMPETMQVGLVTYTDWEKANDFDPFTHNQTVLTPDVANDPTPGEAFNPDLTAGFEYARYVTPDVPEALAGADLTDPSQVSDAELLSFLGEHTNITGDDTLEPTGSINGSVYNDQNGNSTRDANEPGLAGVTIYSDLNLNGALDDAEPSITTDASGDFDLTDLAFDTHSIRVVVPDGFEIETDVATLTLAEGVTVASASFGLNEIIVDPPANPDAPEMAIGMNLNSVTDWTTSWVFRDAFKLARSFTIRSTNTTIWEGYFNGPPEVDADGWVTSIPADTINEEGHTITYYADSILFSQGGNPAGIYRAEWSGEGEITFGAAPVETGTTEDGRSYALIDVAEDQTLHIRIDSTNPDDYIRDIQLFMPEYNGHSLEMDNWQPGSDESPFHPLFLERLEPFDTLRFMQWQQVNRDGRDVLTIDDLRPATHANQGTTDRSTYNGVSVEYQVQLANDLSSNAWFNMPHQANDDYVRTFAEYVRDNIHDDAQVFVEYSNEVWNYAFGFEANAWIGEQQELPENEGLSFVQVWAQEARRDFGIWSEVFAGQEDRLTRVAAGQQNNVWLTGQLLANMNGEFDAVSSTSYAGLEGEHLEWVNESTTEEEIIDYVIETSVPWSLETQAAHVALAEQYSDELGRDIQFVTYEGGSHLSAFGYDHTDLVQSATEHPRFREVYEHLLNGMEQLGIDMHTQYVFTSTGQPSPWGEFGVLHEMDQPLEDSHEYNALVDFIAGDLDAPAVEVSIEATDAVAHELGDTGEFTVTRTGLLFNDLTVNYAIDGSATSGEDYEALSGTIVIPAGETSAVINVTPLLDSDIVGDEGSETIELTLSASDDFQVNDAQSSATVTLLDNEFAVIGDQTMSRNTDTLEIELPSELSGQSVNYEAAITENLVAGLQAEHQLHVQWDDFGLNWGGHNEKWVRGDEGYYYILPSAELYLWSGSFETSTRLAGLEDRYYNDPTLIINAESVAASVSMNDSTLVIDPEADFTGSFEVQLTATSGGVESLQTFMVTVQNSGPSIEPIDDQTVSISGQLVLDLGISDPDGDELTIEVNVAGSLAAQLRDEFGLVAVESLNNWGENWGGQGDKWLQGNDGDWFFLLPDGSLNQWTGSFETSTQLGIVGTEYYNDPQLLLDANSAPVAAEIVNGQLVISPQGQTGTFEIEVIVSDGELSASTQFALDVTNSSPELSIEDQTLVSGGSIQLQLPAVDADGHALEYTIEIPGDELSQLDAEHGFWSEGEYWTNYLGNSERWIRDADNVWHYLLPTGELFRWEGSFESSTLVASLDPEVYDDPSLLTDPAPSEITVDIDGNGQLTIAVPSGFTGDVQIQVTVSDGFTEVSTEFFVYVPAMDETDEVFAALDLELI